MIAQSNNSIVSYQLPGLKQQAERNFEAGISELSAAENQLAVLERKGMLRIVDFETLQDVASKDFSKDFPGGDTHIHCAIAPDGSTVAMPGRLWWKPGALWNVSSGELTQVNLRTSRPLVFANNQTVVSWYTPSQSGQLDDRLVFTDTNSTPPKGREVRITGTDTKDTLEIQAWTAAKNVVNVGLRGRIGTLWWNNGYETDRYVNLWPFEQEHVEGLCSMYPKGLLALVQGSKILVFEHRADAGDLPGADFCVAPARSGAVAAEYNFQLVYCPYDLRQQSQRTILVNPYGEKWHPWTVAVSADDSTIVLLVQQSDNFYVGGQYGPTRALVFRPGNWQTAEKPEAWKVQAAFEIDMPPPLGPWDLRTLAISADGATLAYATQGGVIRYSTKGEKLGRVTGWDTTICRSSDGTLMAGALADNRIQWLDVATGKTGEIKSNLKPVQMCFVRDNSGIVVGDKKSITRYDLKTGDQQWSKPSKLLPLAWPANGDRFVALQPDDTDLSQGFSNTRSIDRTLDGSLVLAKTDTSEIVSIVAKYGSNASLADFSPSEKEVVLREGRWQSKLLRSISPDEATAFLRQLTATGAVVEAPSRCPNKLQSRKQLPAALKCSTLPTKTWRSINKKM